MFALGALDIFLPIESVRRKMSVPTPTLDEWRRLYEAAIQLKEQGPWEWMWEDEIFGIRNPETGETGYVSIMGTEGEHLALAVYLGSEGLDGFWRMENNELIEDPTFLLEVPQLQVSFEDREILHKTDRDVIKALGLRFRGRQAWPLFRSFVPGCAPWFLTPTEARFLTVAIEQALNVAGRLVDEGGLADLSEEDDQYLFRVYTEAGWEDQWLHPDPIPMRPPPTVDTRRLEKMRNELPQQEFTLEADLFTLTTFIKDEDDERPYLPYHLMVVEADTGFIVGGELLLAKPSLDAVWEQVGHKMLDAIERIGGLPYRIAVRSERLQGLLVPITAGLGIRLQPADRLPALDEAREALEEWLD
jgi:hypothetical protein